MSCRWLAELRGGATQYNQEAIYYGAHSSNHAENAAPEIALLRDYMPGAKSSAKALMAKFNRTCDGGDPGLTFPSHLAPFGLDSSVGPSPNGDQRLRWNGELGMSVLLWDWVSRAALT